jgi:predicted nucleic acid-binding protein
VTSGLTLDAGALIAFERRDEKTRALLRQAVERGLELHVVPGVVAQTRRGSARPALVAALLNSVEVRVPSFDGLTARAVGELCGATGHSDIVDVHVALHARLHGHAVVTSDPQDIGAVHPSLRLIVV